MALIDINIPPGVYRNAKIKIKNYANALTCARAIHQLFGDVVHEPSESADAMCIGFVAPKAHWLYPHWGSKHWVSKMAATTGMHLFISSLSRAALVASLDQFCDWKREAD